MSGIKIQLNNVDKKFGDLKVLKDIKLTIKPGQFVAIVGKSGCGKSTLLRLIAGLETPSNGTILFNEKQVKGLHSDTRIMFQDSRLLPWKSVLENVEIGVTDKNKKNAETSLSLVGLVDKQKEWPAVLSGGQKQRVSLARALAGKPKLLLFDEPLGALDALTRLEMQGLIEKLWNEEKFTAILVTHDVSEAIRLADRVIVIKDGGIESDISVPLARPRHVDNEFIHYQNIILNQLMHEQR
ncbi:ATP-binding cassette domain-containing protein [Peribacillus sp. NJ11]|uniref:ABC transporter ATP-binding protein n=1 Tax=Peribacillus sp. NJ11 TaxID=3055861 RepID=UPI0025A22EE1|nr:ATP-binding cassette domain-containing protein [Peribacillus sp. NJ11]MDM5224352.1 ATP-binding cassette domain-containing protein [Peribacillus sp. NJ11]